MSEMQGPSEMTAGAELGDLNRQAQEHFGRHCAEHGYVKPCPSCAAPRRYWHARVGGW